MEGSERVFEMGGLSEEMKEGPSPTAHRCLICGVLSDNMTEYHAIGDPLICWDCCKQDVVLKCVCNHLHETQLMLQCETCFHWQHGPCENIHFLDHVPQPYTCSYCQGKQKPTANGLLSNRDLSVQNNGLQF